MTGIFAPDGKLAVTLNKIADLAILNVLWLLCSIPVITAGASTTALHYATIKMEEGEQGCIIKNFFHSFKENFRQATGIWLMCMAAIGILAADFYIIFWKLPDNMHLLYFPVCIISIAFLLTFNFVFAVLAFFKATVIKNIKNAFFMAILHLPYTLIIIAVGTIPILLLFIFSENLVFVTFLDVIIMPALCNRVNAKSFLKIFCMHIPEDIKNSEQKY